MHVLEIPFIFNTFFKRDTFFLPKKTKETEELSEKMMSSWVSFAKTGNPNYNGNLNWPQYDTEKRATMIFDNDIRIAKAPLDKERQIWYGMNMWSKL
jgi:para-nitrobenzyl esterase